MIQSLAIRKSGIGVPSVRAALCRKVKGEVLIVVGAPLGGDRGRLAEVRGKGTVTSAEVRAAKADERAADVAPLIRELRDNGASLRQIAGELTSRGILTPRGSQWTATAVKRAVERSANV